MRGLLLRHHADVRGRRADPEVRDAYAVLVDAQEAGVQAAHRRHARASDVDAAARRGDRRRRLRRLLRAPHRPRHRRRGPRGPVRGRRQRHAVGSRATRSASSPASTCPGRFGLRLEDIVVATADGPERLNRAARDLAIVVLAPPNRLRGLRPRDPARCSGRPAACCSAGSRRGGARSGSATAGCCASLRRAWRSAVAASPGSSRLAASGRGASRQRWARAVTVLGRGRRALAVSVRNRGRAGSTAFDPRLDLVAPVAGLCSLAGAASFVGGDYPLSLARLVVGAVFLGAVADAMLLGHWYLVQPGLAPRPDPGAGAGRRRSLWPLELGSG